MNVIAFILHINFLFCMLPQYINGLKLTRQLQIAFRFVLYGVFRLISILYSRSKNYVIHVQQILCFEIKTFMFMVVID